MPPSWLEEKRKAALEAYEAEEVPTWRRSGFWTTTLRKLELDALEPRRYEAVNDLPESLRSDKGVSRPAVASGPVASSAAAGSEAGTLREFKESAERAWLVEKLRENAWNISKTAEVIGTPRSNLYKKLEQYAIRQETDG